MNYSKLLNLAIYQQLSIQTHGYMASKPSQQHTVTGLMLLALLYSAQLRVALFYNNPSPHFLR